jgi:hypothetical protein
MLNRDLKNLGILSQRSGSFLQLCLEPRLHGLADVVDGLGLGKPLANTTRKAGHSTTIQPSSPSSKTILRVIGLNPSHSIPTRLR